MPSFTTGSDAIPPQADLYSTVAASTSLVLSRNLCEACDILDRASTASIRTRWRCSQAEYADCHSDDMLDAVLFFQKFLRNLVGSFVMVLLF